MQFLYHFNPISAGGTCKLGYAGGGSIWPPPSKSHVWCPNMTNDTSLENSCALLLESANLQKLNFLSQKVCPKNEKLYIFEKPLTMLFQIWKNFAKF